MKTGVTYRSREDGQKRDAIREKHVKGRARERRKNERDGAFATGDHSRRVTTASSVLTGAVRSRERRVEREGEGEGRGGSKRALARARKGERERERERESKRGLASSERCSEQRRRTGILSRNYTEC